MSDSDPAPAGTPMVHADGLSDRSGFAANLIMPFLTLAGLMLGSVITKIDTSTTKGVIFGAIVTALISAVTFLQKAKSNPSVSSSKISIADLAVVNKNTLEVLNREPPA